VLEWSTSLPDPEIHLQFVKSSHQGSRISFESIVMSSFSMPTHRNYSLSARDGNSRHQSCQQRSGSRMGCRSDFLDFLFFTIVDQKRKGPFLFLQESFKLWYHEISEVDNFSVLNCETLHTRLYIWKRKDLDISDLYN